MYAAIDIAVIAAHISGEEYMQSFYPAFYTIKSKFYLTK